MDHPFLARQAKNGVAYDEGEQIAAGQEIQDIFNVENDPHLREYVNDRIAKPGDRVLLSDLT